MTTALEPEAEQIRRLVKSSDPGPIVMINLLRFKPEADGIDSGLSGAEAYGRYAEGVAPHLERVGGRLLEALHCQEGVIGPAQPEWDMVAIVSYPSREAFLAMTADPEYLEVHRHRVAALADSRLILSRSLDSLREAGGTG
ncbi:MAG: DUF1330 domain-containing protein [Solirubrobacterales bacterium]